MQITLIGQNALAKEGVWKDVEFFTTYLHNCQIFDDNGKEYIVVATATLDRSAEGEDLDYCFKVNVQTMQKLGIQFSLVAFVHTDIKTTTYALMSPKPKEPKETG